MEELMMAKCRTYQRSALFSHQFQRYSQVSKSGERRRAVRVTSQLDWNGKKGYPNRKRAMIIKHVHYYCCSKQNIQFLMGDMTQKIKYPSNDSRCL